MKFNRLVLFMIGVLLLVCAAALFAGEDDMSSLCDEVLAKMRNSRRDVHGDSSWARWLFVNLGSDSNRVCQVAEEVYARAADKMDQEDALLLINRYGSLNQRPFIESCVTNVACGRFRNHIGAYAWSCLSAETNQVATIDSMLAFCDSSYKWSRRRLNVLRQAYAQTTIEAMRACLNARIQELEAYPEASLPE